MRHALLALSLAATAVVATAAPASAHSAPPPAAQGGTWSADGSGPAYCAKRNGVNMRTRASQHGLGEYQRLLGVPITRRCDRATTHAVWHVQRDRAWLRDTGVIDAPTARAILWPTIAGQARRHGVSAGLLCGHLWAESRWDAGAVGPGGIDLGVAQVVPRYNPGVNAWSVTASIANMARRDAAAIRRYGPTRGPVFYWNGSHARAWTPQAVAYRARIAAAPCPKV